MSPTSYHCSTPHSRFIAETECKDTNIPRYDQIFLKIIFLLFDNTVLANVTIAAQGEQIDAIGQL